MMAALSVLTVLALLVEPTRANNEIVNFGPILCRADEVGHLEDKAARQVSQGWPILYPSSRPTLFSLNPSLQPDGVWLILALDPEEAFLDMHAATATTPQTLATRAFPLLSKGYDEDVTPRDRWLKAWLNRFTWFLGKRFTFRITWAPNFPLQVDAKVYPARTMLAKGKISWKANGEDMERLQEEEDLKGVEPEEWPCPRLYVHLTAREEGVQIPPRQVVDDRAGSGSRGWRALVALAEAYMGPLVATPGQDPAATSLTPIPVHLVLESLYVGVVPQTALTLLAVLVPLLIIAVMCILPPFSRAIKDVARQAHVKVE